MHGFGFVTRLCAGVAAVVALAPATAAAQGSVRRQWISVSYDWLSTQPLHFKEHPVEDLVGRPVEDAQRQPYDYISEDGRTTVDTIEFRRRGHGAGLTVYPLGFATGMTLGIRVSYETLPRIEVAIAGPARVPGYVLEDARAVDLSIGLFVADRAPGWGLGSHAFIAGGFGRVRSDSFGRGQRYFGEGGGGINVGPIGVQLAVKIARNSLDEPIEHSFMTVPITLRGTVSF
jgi:hypothetical protein